MGDIMCLRTLLWLGLCRAVGKDETMKNWIPVNESKLPSGGMLIETYLVERPRLGATAPDGSMTMEAPFCACGVKNLNNRIYSKEVMAKAIAESQRNIESGRALGFVEHPAPFEAADIGNVSHICTKLFLEGDKAWVRMKILPTDRGRNLQAILRGGGAVGLSSRGMGKTETKEGVDYIVAYEIRAVDVVMQPSAKTFMNAADNEVFEGLDLNRTAAYEVSQDVLDKRYQFALSCGFRGDKADLARILERERR
jgi:hypothetical protein